MSELGHLVHPGSRYMYERPLGLGTLGKTFLARQTKENTRVVVKEVSLDKLSTEREHVVALLKELLVFYAPHVVPVTDVLLDPGDEVAYLECPYYEGGSLIELLTFHRERDDPIPEDEIWQVLASIVSTLSYIHAQSHLNASKLSVHGNIKATNVLFSKGGVAKLADMSLTTIYQTATKRLPAPEAEGIDSPRADPNTDIWDLGCLLLQICTLDLTPSLVNIPQLQSRYSRALIDILEGCTRKDPETRLTVSELLDHIQIKSSLEKLSYSPSHISRAQEHNSSEQTSVSLVSGDSFVSTSLFSPVIQRVNLGLSPCSNALTVSSLQDTSLRSEHPLSLSNVRTSQLINSILSDNETEFYISLGDVRKTDSKGKTALMHAVEQNKPKYVTHLLKHEAGLADRKGRTALMLSCARGHQECAQLLLDHETQRHDSAGRTALMYAALSDSASCVELLLPKEAGLVDNKGETALMLAVRCCSISCIPMLVKHEAKKTTNKGSTALMLAVRLGLADCVKLLLVEAGVRNLRQETALQMALKRGNALCASLLIPVEGNLTISTGTSCLLWCIENQFLSVAEQLVAYSAQMQDRMGRTALMYAAERGIVNLVQLLLEQEAGMVENQGRTALMYAALAGQEECVKVLVPHEGGIRDSRGRTALMLSIDNKQFRVVPLLLDEVGISDITGRTALMRAAAIDNLTTAKQLLPEAGKTNCNGETALYIAIDRGAGECVELLAEYEAGLGLENGETLLMWAVRCDKPQYIPFLTATARERDGEGEPALFMAARLNRKDCLWALLEHEHDIVTDLGHSILDLVVENNWLSLLDIITAFILSAGTAIPIQDRKGITRSSETKLMRAATKNDIEALSQDLSSLGRICKGWTALRASAFYGCAEATRWLLGELGIRGDDGFTTLMTAAQEGHIDCARMLIGEVKKATPQGTTALMLAARHGHVSCVSLLQSFECGMISYGGTTALHAAASQGHEECVKLLLDESGTQDNSGTTALMLAAIGGHDRCVYHLLGEAGLLDTGQWTALQRAMWAGSNECVSHLLGLEQSVSKVTELMVEVIRNNMSRVTIIMQTSDLFNAMINNKDSRGLTALMYASHHGNVDMVKVLSPFEQAEKDNAGWTALMFAAEGGHADCFAYLTSEFTICNNEGVGPIDILRRNGYTKALRSLKRLMR
ncbi:Kinase, NEK [Giardia muris]|uniref:Kinase, NEK n=1 Tax=Giardia muris TaxID=5742 RepID=A0A4Z1SR31_GIAMU|nr:Kinase, NEK [Giardia muris]|eukprot:TNJ28332.1 Kinase, NEK [Giardia muris]